MPEYELLQQELSLYSGKARAYLRYKNIPFRQTFAGLNVYRKKILPLTGVAMIPVVITPEGEAIQDTTVIIDRLEERFPDRAVYPNSPVQRIAAMLLELYGDEWLLLPAMHYRWNFPDVNQPYIFEEFGRVAWENGPAILRRAVGTRLGKQFRGFVGPLGITPETIPAIEDWWLETLDVLDQHFASHDYLLGGRASIGDFGFMGPIYAHLGRDPYPKKLMLERAPHVMAWIERMHQINPEIETWVEDDAVPDSLNPVFQRQFSEQFPVLRDTAEHLATWVAENPGGKLKRSIGKHRFRIGSAEGERMMLTYSLWMFQRILDEYAALDSAARQAVDRWLSGLGHTNALNYSFSPRIGRDRNRCVVEA